MAALTTREGRLRPTDGTESVSGVSLVFADLPTSRRSTVSRPDPG